MDEIHPILQLATWADMQQVMPIWFLPVTAFVFGSIVGSFLNVCIHRMPRGHSIVAPLSHCYSCTREIAWFDNIPLISYLFLRGKCRYCRAPFSVRYWLVELLTAILFAVIWEKFHPSQAAVYTLFVSGLIVATFIDFEHYIIPNEITLGGIVAGILCSAFVPSLQNEMSHVMATLWSLAGAGACYGTLWVVLELGKRFLGVKKLALPKSTEVSLTPEGIGMESNSERWEDIFSRETDVLTFTGTDVHLGGKTWQTAEIQVDWQEVKVDEEVFRLGELGKLTATTEIIYVPREAMGFGDVKFIAAIGAFLGPKAIFFVILVSSLTGSLVGLTSMLIGKREWGLRLPYGPYLAFAALLWPFWGSRFNAYFFNSWLGQ